VIISRYERPSSRNETWAAVIFLALPFLIAGIAPLLQLPGVEGAPFVVFAAGWAWFSYMMLTRAIWRLELTAAELRWRAPVRGGVIPLSQVTSVQWKFRGRKGSIEKWVVLIEADDRKPLRIMAHPRLVAFTDDVKTAAPHVKVKFPPELAWARAGYQGPYGDPVRRLPRYRGRRL
jgi:hypothetical protein